MVTKIFLGISLLGAEWVLYLLLLISVTSIALVIERYRYYSAALSGMDEFRKQVRTAAVSGDLCKIREALDKQKSGRSKDNANFESELTSDLVDHLEKNQGRSSPDVLAGVAQDAITRTRNPWEKNLALLATIGSNAPFVGLFGTVIGIIQAFHHLAQDATGGAGIKTVTAGLSEALIATAVGILVAIPAVVAFNLFQRKVRTALNEAEALKSYLIAKLSRGEQ